MHGDYSNPLTDPGNNARPKPCVKLPGCIAQQALGLIMKRIATIAVISLIFLCSCSVVETVSDGSQLPTPVAPKRGSGKEPTDGDYWAVRYTYPTYEFDQRWLTEAADEHRAMEKALPNGSRNRDQVRSRGLNLAPDSFTSLGPRPLNGSFSMAAGRVNVIIPHPTDSTIAYIGSDGGGVWKTTNCCTASTTWTPLNDDPMFNSIAIGDLVMDPNDSDTIYAGTGDLRYGSYSFGSAGLLRTQDGGTTWEILGTDVFSPVRPQAAGEFPQYQAIGKVQVDPRDSDIIIVGTKTGLYFSYDHGANWTDACLTNAFTTQRQDITGLLVADNGTSTDLYASVGTRGHNTTVQPDLDQNGANGIYKTTVPASGCPVSWQLVSRPDNGWPAGTGGGTPFPTNSLGRVDLAMAPSNDQVIYAQVADVNTRQVRGVWRTTNGGTTWEQRATNADFGGCDGTGAQAWYDMGMTIAPNDTDVVFLSAVDLFRSDNGGDTFTNVTCGYSGGAQAGVDVHVDHHARAYVGGDPSRILIGSDGGMYYASNADTANPRQIDFIHLNDTLSTIEFYSGDITANFAFSANPGAVGGAQDNGSSVATWSGPPGPAVWTEVWGGDGIYARIEPVLGQRWYVESQRGNLGISQNGPNGPYQGVAEPWSGDRRPFLFPFEIYKYDCPPTGCERLIAGSFRVWETINGGLSGGDWYSNSPDLTKNTLGDRSIINQLHYSFSDPTIAIVGTNDGNVWFGFDMGQGTADSANWVNVTDGNTILPNRPILDVITDPINPVQGYAAVGGFEQNTPAQPGHVYRVTCNADCTSFSWEDKSGNLPNVPVNSIMVNPNRPSQVFAGTDWGLYFTDDIDSASPTWAHFNAGLPSVMIWDMAVDNGFTTLALFTRSRGAYVWPLAGPQEEILTDGFEN